ncbi:hypothetical protein GOP47_0030374 [Adiantum capillus-veneris]|nr:hypothetical protein GOP47_0030374 [Adiantum capillus-veneris]
MHRERRAHLGAWHIIGTRARAQLRSFSRQSHTHGDSWGCEVAVVLVVPEVVGRTRTNSMARNIQPLGQDGDAMSIALYSRRIRTRPWYRRGRRSVILASNFDGWRGIIGCGRGGQEVSSGSRGNVSRERPPPCVGPAQDGDSSVRARNPFLGFISAGARRERPHTNAGAIFGAAGDGKSRLTRVGEGVAGFSAVLAGTGGLFNGAGGLAGGDGEGAPARGAKRIVGAGAGAGAGEKLTSGFTAAAGDGDDGGARPLQKLGGRVRAGAGGVRGGRRGLLATVGHGEGRTRSFREDAIGARAGTDVAVVVLGSGSDAVGGVAPFDKGAATVGVVGAGARRVALGEAESRGGCLNAGRDGDGGPVTAARPVSGGGVEARARFPVEAARQVAPLGSH